MIITNGISVSPFADAFLGEVVTFGYHADIALKTDYPSSLFLPTYDPCEYSFFVQGKTERAHWRRMYLSLRGLGSTKWLKWYNKKYLSTQSNPYLPKCFYFGFLGQAPNIDKPCLVKSGMGVNWKVRGEKIFPTLLEGFSPVSFHADADRLVIIQEFIQASTELRSLVFNDGKHSIFTFETPHGSAESPDARFELSEIHAEPLDKYDSDIIHICHDLGLLNDVPYASIDLVVDQCGKLFVVDVNPHGTLDSYGSKASEAFRIAIERLRRYKTSS